MFPILTRGRRVDNWGGRRVMLLRKEAAPSQHASYAMIKRLSLAFICPVVICVSGCGTLAAKADTMFSDDSELIQGFKAIKGTGATTGISREAREIERSLSR